MIFAPLLNAEAIDWDRAAELLKEFEASVPEVTPEEWARIRRANAVMHLSEEQD